MDELPALYIFVASRESKPALVHGSIWMTRNNPNRHELIVGTSMKLGIILACFVLGQQNALDSKALISVFFYSTCLSKCC
jgi:hypothetical protein